MSARIFSVAVGLAVTASALVSCGGGEPTGSSVPSGATLALSLQNVATIEGGGRLEAWVVDAQGTAHSLGTVSGSSATFTSPVANPASFLITYEPAGDTDQSPSSHRFLAGRFQGARAALSLRGAVTASDLQLRERPGQFTMFSPSDNHAHGYPSHEESGIWLFNMAPRETPQNDMWVRLTQLQNGWTYEGWMVRDYGTPGAIWLSYGKFTPDATGAVNSRDDTGWGPFSGVIDFMTAGEEEFPGDDWISDPLGFGMPGGLPLPLDLREKNGSGAYRWTHLITIEPMSDKGEGVGNERPFVIRPYRDPFGDGVPGDARTITFRGDGVPTGEVVRR